LEEQVAKTSQEHHHIGVSQNHHEHIGTFLRRNAGDPAIKVSIAAEKIYNRCIDIRCPSGFFAQVKTTPPYSHYSYPA
jgi:hypothetical protein